MGYVARVLKWHDFLPSKWSYNLFTNKVIRKIKEGRLKLDNCLSGCDANRIDHGIEIQHCYQKQNFRTSKLSSSS